MLSPATKETCHDAECPVLVHSIASTVLEAPPSCIACTPIAPHLFVVGTYSLDVGDGTNADSTSAIENGETNAAVQTRIGSLILFQLIDNIPYANLFQCCWKSSRDCLKTCY